MRVAILGTGLIGASIGLGLKQRITTAHIVGYDRELDVAEAARKRGAVDEVARDLPSAVRDADLVILAVPVLAIQKLMGEISDHLKPDAVITDTGSSKAEIIRSARDLLREHPGFVASHPMAGKTEIGPDAADPNLFQGARWVVAPSVHSSDQAIQTVQNLAETLGATVMVMDGDEHDAYVAAISHMPMLAATALFSMGRASEAWPELSMLAAGGFKDMTRLASTDPAMAYDIVVTNRQNIAHWIDRYIATLQELKRRMLDLENEDDLYKLIAATEFEYHRYRNGKVGRETQGESLADDMGMSIQDFMAGAWARERIKELLQGSEERMRKQEEDLRSQRRV